MKGEPYERNRYLVTMTKEQNKWLLAECRRLGTHPTTYVHRAFIEKMEQMKER